MTIHFKEGAMYKNAEAAQITHASCCLTVGKQYDYPA